MRRAVVLASCLLAAGAGCSLVLDTGALREPTDAGTADVATDVALETGPDAAPTDIGRGDGHTGRLDAKPDSVVNLYLPIVAPSVAGARELTVEDPTKLVPGDLVLVWQTTGLTAPSGDPTPIAPGAGSSVGRWELARVVSVGATLSLDRSLAYAYGAVGAQVVRVPEYTEVSVPASASVKAQAWDGRSGGIVAFLATGSITVDGAVSADAAGLRGGRVFLTATYLGGCTALDGTPATGHAAKGEGLTPAAYGATNMGSAPGGRGNVANGGGGGDCHNSGGAGGGGAGAGGGGGLSYSSDGERPVGGMGGAPVQSSARERLFMGGGGGAGEAEDTPGEVAGPGAAGGGVVFLRALEIKGAGTVSASGAAATTAEAQGAGGGGGGGTVLLQITGSASIAARALGGAGGTVIGASGPGGGGGGGRVRVEAAQTLGPAAVTGGTAGGSSTDAGPRGATPGAAGTLE